jgi:selenocysteine lyase/cysteine desulfurase
MRESIKLLREAGIEAIAARLLDLKKHLVLGLKDLGFQIVAPEQGAHATGITTAGHPSAEIGKLFEELQRRGIVASHRFDRQKRGYLRFSPHFYNTHAELDRVLEVLRGEL